MRAPVTYKEDFLHIPNFFKDILWNSLDWEQRDAPRMEYYCSLAGNPYTYGSGPGRRTYEPRPVTKELQEIWTLAEQFCGVKFELLFLNGYENERNQLGWHADDSPEMDDARPIAVVSLGAEREIWFKPQGSKGLDEVDKLLLKNGSICVMALGELLRVIGFDLKLGLLLRRGRIRTTLVLAFARRPFGRNMSTIDLTAGGAVAVAFNFLIPDLDCTGRGALIEGTFNRHRILLTTKVGESDWKSIIQSNDRR